MGLWRKITLGFIWKMAHSSVPLRRPTREPHLPGRALCLSVSAVPACTSHPGWEAQPSPGTHCPGVAPVRSLGCPSGQRAFGTAWCPFLPALGLPIPTVPCLVPFMATLLTLESRSAMSQSSCISFFNHNQPEMLQTSGIPANTLLLCSHFGK